jgi:type IV secretion system protein TrbL
MTSRLTQNHYSVFVISALVSATDVFLFNPVDGLKEWFIWLLNIVAEALFGFLGWLIIETTGIMLFFPPPTAIPELTDMYWNVTFPLFWTLLSVVGTGFFLGQQLFPHDDSADVEKFMKRVFFAVAMVFIVGHGFGLVVEAVNVVGQHLYPDQYKIALGSDTVEGLSTAGFAGLSAIIFAILASWSTVITYFMFLVMLGMRMVIVYTMYTMFPIMIALWITDVGPFKYGKMIAGLTFKASIVLLVFGLLLATILGVGGAIASNAGGDMPGDELGSRDDLVVTAQSTAGDSRVEGGVLADETMELSSTGQDPITSAWFSVYTYYAAIWLCITLTGLLLGGSISTGLTSNIVKGAAMKGGLKRMKSRMNSGGNGFGRSGGGAGAGAGAGAGGGMGGAAGGGSGVGPDSAPEPDDPGPASFGEKLDHVTHGGASAAKEKAGQAKGKVEEGAEAVDETASAAGDKIEEKMTEAGGKAGEAAGAAVSGYGAAAGKSIGAGAGKVAGKTANVAVTAAGKVPKATMKAGNLAKRGGKAYGSVFMQPDAMSSIGEMGRIARESPIGKPGPDDAEVNEVNDNPEDWTGDNANFENVTYEHGGTSPYESGGEEETMQYGTLHSGSGESIDYSGFDVNGDGPKLEDGETYNISNAQVEDYEGDPQVVGGDNTSVESVDSGGKSSGGST